MKEVLINTRVKFYQLRANAVCRSEESELEYTPPAAISGPYIHKYLDEFYVTAPD